MGRLLNRVIRCTQQGSEVEADQRDADLIIQELELSSANSVITLGQNEPRRKEGDNEEPLSPEDATKYQGVVARANYLAADRPDLMYSTKGVCRGMANPTKQDWHKLKSIGRYLVGSCRIIMK